MTVADVGLLIILLMLPCYSQQIRLTYFFPAILILQFEYFIYNTSWLQMGTKIVQH